MHLAYIDGGTGSMALQVLLAGALSAMYALHTSWASVKKKFMKKDATASKPSNQ
jgi:hypothetical protein